MNADEERYQEALRSYMKAGRDVALKIRRGAACVPYLPMIIPIGIVKASSDRRLERLERALTTAHEDPMQESFDQDFTAIDEEFCSLVQAAHMRGGVKVEKRDKVAEFYGRGDYTFREHWALAVARALEKRGYSELERAERTEAWMALFDEEEAKLANSTGRVAAYEDV